MQQETQRTIYSFDPVYNEKSRILILGTMPSPASLAAQMFYSHPRNAFWRIAGEITRDDPGRDNASKRAFLLRNRIALWDTLKCCVREGALDADIKQQQPNDIAALLKKCPLIQAVFLNGSAAYKFYLKYHQKDILLPYYQMPSTSPANATYSYQKKLEAWRKIAEFL